MVDDPGTPGQPDDVALDPEDLLKRLHGIRQGGETADPPTGERCWHDEQFFDDGAVTTIADARVVCVGGIWKPFGRPLPPFVEVDPGDPFANEARPDGEIADPVRGESPG